MAETLLVRTGQEVIFKNKRGFKKGKIVGISADGFSVLLEDEEQNLTSVDTDEVFLTTPPPK